MNFFIEINLNIANRSYLDEIFLSGRKIKRIKNYCRSFFFLPQNQENVSFNSSFVFC